MRVASAVGSDVWLNTDLAAKFLIRREVIVRCYGSRTGSGAMAANMTQPASEQQADERRGHGPARWCRRQIEPDRLRRRRADRTVPLTPGYSSSCRRISARAACWPLRRAMPATTISSRNISAAVILSTTSPASRSRRQPPTTARWRRGGRRPCRADAANSAARIASRRSPSADDGRHGKRHQGHGGDGAGDLPPLAESH